MSKDPGHLDRLRDAVVELTILADDGADEPRFLDEGRAILGKLIEHDDWLPEAFSAASPVRYQQYLLYCDPRERFSVVSFVWGPGQATPIHDHRIWGLVGVLRGRERAIGYHRAADGRLSIASDETSDPGAIALVSPTVGDIHRVMNAENNCVTISIHIYGGNIGRVDRTVFDADTGAEKPFVSTYANSLLPNLWN